MAETTGTRTARPGGLVTVAFLKARLDEGKDHLGIFMPLVLDVVARLPSDTFTTTDVQAALAERHGLAMPRQTIATLLKRAVARKHIQRDVGRYRRTRDLEASPSDVTAETARIEAGQQRLGEALRDHSVRRGLRIESAHDALDMLFRFLEDEQIGLLLGTSPAIPPARDATIRERAIVAEFIQDAIRDDAALRSVLRGILEGLVLYHAAFLPDLAATSRQFRNLRVVFDSVLIRQTLGYEGVAMQALMRETVDVLKAAGVQCLVFDKTVFEIRRILSMYEGRLATAEGRRSLHQVPMARHLLTQHYSPSDIREMAALLEREIADAGFQILPSPSRVRELTSSERALAVRLADPGTKDELEPRVMHDVDCVAGILTLRGGRTSASVEDARAIFVTSSPLVIRNTRLWWEQDEHGIGIEPLAHIRALSNLAWLKRPTLCANLKERELVALCSAALRPTQKTWQRFLHHLATLEKSRKLSSDEVTAVVISAMSDRLLREAEVADDDPSDIDAGTLDEIVDRVKESYAAKAAERVQEVTQQYESKLSELEAQARAANTRAKVAERTSAEQARRRELVIGGRARTLAFWLTRVVQGTVSVLVCGGALALAAGHSLHRGWVGYVIASAVVVFILLEALGILRHVSRWRSRVEARLMRRLRDWLAGEVSARQTTQSGEANEDQQGKNLAA